MSRIAVLGLSSGIFLVLAVLIGVALLAPRAAGAAVVDGALVSCPLAEISLDQGYGVTRTALRPICGHKDAQDSSVNNADK
jgi:hypothetical protein